jgi:hypothetical protein
VLKSVPDELLEAYTIVKIAPVGSNAKAPEAIAPFRYSEVFSRFNDLGDVALISKLKKSHLF